MSIQVLAHRLRDRTRADPIVSGVLSGNRHVSSRALDAGVASSSLTDTPRLVHIQALMKFTSPDHPLVFMPWVGPVVVGVSVTR